MNSQFFIKNLEVHLWRVNLPQFIDVSENMIFILSADETKRAIRFHFEKHRQYFIITRHLLRHTLSLYTDTAPEKIEFSYGQHGKPYLKTNPQNIYFNASHSHDIAIYGLTRHKEIGVDIEKIESEYKISVAKRFFSPDEYSYLRDLPENKKNAEFYAIWAHKEAVIKALGKGLYMPLNTFSILKRPGSTHILLNDKNKEYHLLLKGVAVQTGYQAAFALKPPITTIFYWEWTNKGPVIWKELTIF
jgi:4'-phosphopantetheinyl transferase